jgi:phage terminase large subunit-like protein
VHAHKDPGVWIKLDTAMGSRRQPLTWAITTAGVYDKDVDRLAEARVRNAGARRHIRG